MQHNFPISDKINRSAFLYYNPHNNSPKEEFAQCSTCRAFVPYDILGIDGRGRCIFHGLSIKLDEDYTCGLYVIWPKGKPVPEVQKDHARELINIVKDAKSVTPAESDLVDRQVRCDNCAYFIRGESYCGLYKMLNHHMGKFFDLDINVDPNGCCNANIEVEK